MLLIRIGTVLIYENPIESKVNLHPIISPLKGLANYFLRIVSIQTVKITNVQLQIATAHFKQCHIDSISADTYRAEQY